jgi:hypothetical protein
MTGKALTVFTLMFLLAGCATIDDIEWPEGAYPRDYFEMVFMEDEIARMYQTRDDYLLWITRFYNGYNIAPGWLNLTKQVMDRLEGADPQWRSEVNERLFHLGGRIGSEWAKTNEVRLLNTRHAAVWRDALIESINQGDLDNYITRVESDVESILVGELDKEAIYFERYYIDEFEF